MTPRRILPAPGAPFLRLLLLLCLLCLLTSSACVYFNTYYNAQKYFRQAEKAREKKEQEALVLGNSERPGGSAQVDQLYEKAAKKASLILEKYKESDLVDDAMFLMGRAFYWQGNYVYAMRAFRDLENNFPESEHFVSARYWGALCYEAQGMNDQARPIYRSLFESDSGDLAVRAGIRLGEMAFAEGDYTVAVQEYRTTLEAFPKADLRAELWLRLGEALQALEDTSRYDQALAAFERVLVEKPAPDIEYRARLNTGRLLYARGDTEGALRTYSGLLKDSRFRPFEGQTRILIGQYYQERHELDRALEEYAQVRDDFPQTLSSAMAFYQTGLLYLRDYGDSEQASEYFQEASREKPGSEAAGMAQQMLGYLAELERYRDRIQRADSLAVGADTLAVGADTLAVGADTLAVGGSQKQRVLEDLLAVAELYRDPYRIALPDSAIRYYEEIRSRFPEFEQMSRILYSIAWVYQEMLKDVEAARPYLEQLLEEHPASVHANAARAYLGLQVQTTDEELAAAEFERIEDLRLRDVAALDTYVPLLDSLVTCFPETRTAAKAAFLAAFSYENVRGDSLLAERRYRQVLEKFPHSRYAALVQARDSVRAEGLVGKLERTLKSVGGRPDPGEQIEILALEPDSLDSVMLAYKYEGFALRAHRRGVLRQAREYYELSLEQRRNQPGVLYRLGDIMQEEGFFQDAVDLYQEALGFKTGMLEPQYRLMRIYIADGQVDSANHYLRQVIQRSRRDPQIQQLLDEYPDLTYRDDSAELDLRTLEALDLPLPRDDLRLSFARELDDLPLVRNVVLPALPTGIAEPDTAILDLLVGKRGEVEEVAVFSCEEALRPAAIAAARAYRFFPAVGRRVKEQRVWVELIMPFEAPPSAAGGGEPAAGTQLEGALQDTVSAVEGPQNAAE